MQKMFVALWSFWLLACFSGPFLNDALNCVFCLIILIMECLKQQCSLDVESFISNLAQHLSHGKVKHQPCWNAKSIFKGKH